MFSRSDFAVVVLSLISGFGGGVLSTTRPQPASAASQQPIRATKFELVSTSGKTIAFWGPDEHDQVVIAFTGGTQNQFAALGLLDQQPFLQLNGADGKRRASLAVGWHDKPVLALSDEKWQGRVSLGFILSHTPDPGEETLDRWGLLFGAPPTERGRRFPAGIGYSKNNAGTGWDGSIVLEGSTGQVWKAP